MGSTLTGFLARMHQHTYVSPSDNIMSPATQKLAAFKNKHLGKGSVHILLRFSGPFGC
jgi:hypothetical protein